MFDINNAWVALIAQICHEANSAIQESLGEEPSPKWDKAPDWQRESSKEGVVKALEGKTPEELHEAWCEFKIQNGWVYGLIKSDVAKTHPCLVPYSELPSTQQLKDHVFGAIVRSFQDASIV